MDIRGQREVTFPIMIVAVGGMGERRGGPGSGWCWIGGGGAERCVVRGSRQAGPGWGAYRN